MSHASNDFSQQNDQLNQSCFRCIEGQSELGQALLQLHQILLRLPLRPETHHAVIRVAHNDHIATDMLFTPLPCPQIQHVVKIDIRKQGRQSAGNDRANSRMK